MEDVLFNRNPIHPSGRPGAEADSWKPRDEGDRPSARPGLPFPLSSLFTLVETHRGYAADCRELAGLFATLRGRYSLEHLLHQAVQGRFPRVWIERFLFILLEARPSDFHTAAYVLQFRHLKRLLLRVERRTPLNPRETSLARELIQALSLSGFLDFEDFCRKAAATFDGIRAGGTPVSGDLGLLVYLIRCESGAMEERKNWLERENGGGDPETVARLSPRLRHLEDRVSRARELAARLGTFSPLSDTPIGLEEAMGAGPFAELRESLLRNPSLDSLRETLDLQKAKRVPTRDLIALSTLCRWLMEARGAPAGPLEWIRLALQSYQRGHFRLETGAGPSAVDLLLAEAEVEREGGSVFGNFGEIPYDSWIARDGLTRPYRSANPDRVPPALEEIVAANLHREAILLDLLDNPKVHGTPGVVESMVRGSESPVVHAKIASRRELHTGPANEGVALALAKSGVSIPAGLVRALIHPAIIPFSQMKILYRSRSALRPEVAEELHVFLTQAYAV